jgi:cytidylate kinase
MEPGKKPVIGVVGPCAAGKSTLIAGLEKRGLSARHIAQEHSYVPTMWQRIANPDLLIFLDVSYPTTIIRRQIDWEEAEYLDQQRRLEHARQHADCYIDTEQLSIDEVLQAVLHFLEEQH